MKPYFYKIQQLSTGKYYVGCQYGKYSDPEKFWVTYFTSCDSIRNGNKTDFIVISVKPRKDAKEYERKYLSKMYSMLGREAFENYFINRNLAPGILFTEEIRDKMSVGIKKSVEQRKSSGTYIPTMSGKTHTEDTKNKISKQKREYYSEGGEHPRGMSGKTHTEETKNKIGQSTKEHSGLRGKFGEEHPTGNTKWWNNGTIHKRCVECPGEEWVEGRIYKKRK